MKNLTKYIITILAIVVIAAAGFFIYNQKGEDANIEEKRAVSLAELTQKANEVDRNKVIIVGIGSDYPPMTFQTIDGTPDGFDVELARATVKSMGKEIKFRVISWGKKRALLNSGDIDLVWAGMTITEKRKKKYELSAPYLADRIAVIVNKQSYIKSLDDLANVTVGVQEGSSDKELIRKFRTSDNKAILKAKDDYSGPSDVLSALLSGEIDAAVLSRNVAGYYMKRTPDVFRMIDSTIGNTEQLGVGIKKGRIELLNDVNSALAKLEATGKIKELKAKWFGK